MEDGPGVEAVTWAFYWLLSSNTQLQVGSAEIILFLLCMRPCLSGLCLPKLPATTPPPPTTLTPLLVSLLSLDQAHHLKIYLNFS